MGRNPNHVSAFLVTAGPERIASVPATVVGQPKRSHLVPDPYTILFPNPQTML